MRPQRSPPGRRLAKGKGLAGPRRAQTAKDRALRLLSVRSRSRAELRSRLLQAGFERPEIEETLTDLEAVGLIDDERFAREFVRDRVATRLAGRRVIRTALQQKGVAADVLDEALEEAGDEEERAFALAAKRAARLNGLPPETAYRRLYGLLVRRGYAHDVATRACATALADLGSPEPDASTEGPAGD
ncbi:MAG TPA: regulatory protein RecX [Actinomycetota bacterium]|jgi:regulatory protein